MNVYLFCLLSALGILVRKLLQHVDLQFSSLTIFLYIFNDLQCDDTISAKKCKYAFFAIIFFGSYFYLQENNHIMYISRIKIVATTQRENRTYYYQRNQDFKTICSTIINSNIVVSYRRGPINNICVRKYTFSCRHRGRPKLLNLHVFLLTFAVVVQSLAEHAYLVGAKAILFCSVPTIRL